MTLAAGRWTGLLLLAACAAPDPAPVAVTRAYAFAPPTTSEAAAYVDLHNPGGRADTLLAVSTPAAGGVMLHRSVAAGAMIRMEHVDVLPVPAGEVVRMEPGALHLMLPGLHHLPAAGDTLELVLTFRTAGQLPVRAPVIAYGSEAPGGTP